MADDIKVGDKVTDQRSINYKVSGVESVTYGIAHIKVSMTTEE